MWPKNLVINRPIFSVASCTIGTVFFPGGKERPGRDADPSPPSSVVVMKSKAIPLLPLWAVRPVQSLSACTRVHVTFTLFSVWPVSYFISTIVVLLHVYCNTRRK